MKVDKMLIGIPKPKTSSKPELPQVGTRYKVSPLLIVSYKWRSYNSIDGPK